MVVLVVVVGRSLLAGLVRPVPVVMTGVLGEDRPNTRLGLTRERRMSCPVHNMVV